MFDRSIHNRRQSPYGSFGWFEACYNGVPVRPVKHVQTSSDATSFGTSGRQINCNTGTIAPKDFTQPTYVRISASVTVRFQLAACFALHVRAGKIESLVGCLVRLANVPLVVVVNYIILFYIYLY